jgi:murein DD-endopeptidase MepM/ murein hydrolase activator NlpD
MKNRKIFVKTFKPQAVSICLSLIICILIITLVFIFFYRNENIKPPIEIDNEQLISFQTNNYPIWEAELHTHSPSEISRVIAIQKGDNLMGVLIRAGVERGLAYAAIEALKKYYDPRRDLNIGDELQISFYPQTRYQKANKFGRIKRKYSLKSVTIPVSFDRLVKVTLSQEGKFEANEAKRNIRRETIAVSGIIKSNLFVDATSVGVSPTILAKLIRIYSFDIDFQRDLWEGDKFELMYEQIRNEKGIIIRDGYIHYAKLTLRNTKLPLYRYVTSSGNLDYFNEKGNSARKTLMLTPIDGARLSSRFGKRRHPILGYTKMHMGIDFAAPIGTPIYAAGNGSIIKAGRNGGYGKYILIRHNSTYKTAYGHLSKFAKKTRVGNRVKQGEIIGYVGNTGRSTGPHLHYEVIQNGRKINPRTVRIPSGEKLKGAELQTFILFRDTLTKKFSNLKQIKNSSFKENN